MKRFALKVCNCPYCGVTHRSQDQVLKHSSVTDRKESNIQLKMPSLDCSCRDGKV